MFAKWDERESECMLIFFVRQILKVIMINLFIKYFYFNYTIYFLNYINFLLSYTNNISFKRNNLSS